MSTDHDEYGYVGMIIDDEVDVDDEFKLRVLQMSTDEFMDFFGLNDDAPPI